MRIIVVFVFLFFSFMQPAIALTKCILDGKVSYKVGPCPKDASSKYWVNNKFVEERKLKKNRQKNSALSEESFKRMNTPIVRREDESEEEFDVEEQEQARKPKKMQVSNETAHFQLKKVDNEKDNAPEVNVPQSHEYVNDKLSEMQKKLDQHNKELQQLQQH